MGNSVFYAHSLENEPPEKWQTLSDHLNGTARLARRFADAFGAGHWGKVAGLLHDLGKSSYEFQEYLTKSNDPDSHIENKAGKVDHSTSGAQIIYEHLKSIGKLLAYCIAGHHSGLLDGSGVNGATLTDRLGKTVASPRISLDSFSLPDLTNPIQLDNKRVAFQLYMYVKMLYSCLVDADFLDTESFLSQNKAVSRGDYPSLNNIMATFQKEISSLHQSAKKSPLNEIRKSIYDDCVKAAELDPGLFSLTVPTGGGKTLSSMAFALQHAINYHKQRIIYVIPYTSIIEQNAEIFRKYLGEDAVLEHHSNYEPKEEDYRTRVASENWDAPIIVTTSVQFYESFFANRSSRCRKLHNVANSIVVFDEIQTIPVDYLLPCIELLRELSINYKCSSILCTATQPAIQYRDDFKLGLDNVREIIAGPQAISIALKRVTPSVIPEKSDEEIANRLKKHSQVLCIVNTKKQAKTLYQLIGDCQEHFHLSTLMCPEHRRDCFRVIRDQLNPKDKKTCRIISTQLIEAGVDIDLPVVYRAMSGLDSIAQAAGRCNREGRLKTGHVYIFEPEDGYPAGHLTHTANEAIGTIRRHENDIFSLDAIDDYFKNLYWIKGNDQLDKKEIINDIRAGIKSLDFPFRSIAENFKLIENNTKPIIISYDDDAKRLIDQIPHHPYPRTLIRKLQKYTVQVHTYQWDVLVEHGVIEVVGDLFPVLIRDELYHNKYGLEIDNLTVNPEDLMI